MAEGGETWWGGWLQSAKQKSVDVIDFMKRDLDEFTQTFQDETRSVVNSAAGALREKLQMDDSESAACKMKRSVSSLLGTVTQAFTLPREANEDEVCIIRNNEPVTLDRVQSQLYAMQIEPKTYLEDPQPLEEYEKWLHTFDLEQMQAELSEIVINNAEVQALYMKLVPAMVSHVVFWHRYFFNLNQLKESEVRKHALLQRAEDVKEEIRWDDEDITTNGEISDQLATQILSDYEAECKGRKRSDDGNDSKSSFQVIEESNCHDQTRIKEIQMSISSIEIISTKDIELETKSETKDDQLVSSTENIIETSTLTTKEKGDLIVVLKNSNDRVSPSSSNKESSNDEEWEKDFELEVTEEDVQAARTSKSVEGAAARQEGEDEDWENWE